MFRIRTLPRTLTLLSTTLITIGLLIPMGLLSGCGTQLPIPKNNNNTNADEPRAASHLFYGDVSELTISSGPLVLGQPGIVMDQVMDRGDRDNLLVAVLKRPVGHISQWVNARRHVQYQVNVLEEGTSPQGQYCRLYMVTMTQGGQTQQQGRGKLCEVAPNNWQFSRY